jgi:hypothetical protein
MENAIIERSNRERLALGLELTNATQPTDFISNAIERLAESVAWEAQYLDNVCVLVPATINHHQATDTHRGRYMLVSQTSSCRSEREREKDIQESGTTIGVGRNQLHRSFQEASRSHSNHQGHQPKGYHSTRQGHRVLLVTSTGREGGREDVVVGARWRTTRPKSRQHKDRVAKRKAIARLVPMQSTAHASAGLLYDTAETCQMNRVKCQSLQLLYCNVGFIFPTFFFASNFLLCSITDGTCH